MVTEQVPAGVTGGRAAYAAFAPVGGMCRRAGQYEVVERWPQALASVPRARHHLQAQLAAWQMHSLAEDAELVLTELMANAVTHAFIEGVGRLVETTYELTEDGLLIEVADPDGERWPRLRPILPDEPGARGLRLVDALTEQQWGIAGRGIGLGKVVWALLRYAR